ncbi:translation initiation factor IF-2 [Spirosoma rhododendri]|uniref:Translation initiation factor IF-2 n=1 Tax=Spirosoma rhododendri TaxID=2728024 RepID=A0A7L5DSJ2_9BACT|nr:translation initiation factor IF-2 [Spirosoma rhododendri]QJD81085.1 translation initiation factor IF-2 [Spirosoma rhododendri]
MAEDKSMRLSQVAKILNKGLSSVANSLSAKGFKVEINPNTKINMEQLEVLAKEYKSTELLNGTRRTEAPAAVAEAPRRQEEDVVMYRRDDARRSDSEAKPATPAVAAAPQPQKPATESAPTGLPGLTVIGKIDLNARPGDNRPSAQPAPAAKAPVEEVQKTPEPVQPVVEAPKPAQPTPAPVAPVAEAPKPAPAPAPAEAAPVAKTEPKPVVAEPAPVVAEQPKPKPVETPAAQVTTPAPQAATPAPQPIKADPTPTLAQAPTPAPAVAKESAPAPKADVTPAPAANTAPESETTQPTETIRAAGSHQLGGLKILGKIELPVNNPRQGGGGGSNADKKKRKRIRGRDGVVGGSAAPGTGAGQPQGQGNANVRNDRAPRDGQGNDRPPRDGNRAPGQATPANGQNGQTSGNNANANRGGQNQNNTNNNNANRGGNRSGGGSGNNRNNNNNRREAPSQADVRKSIQQTNARMQGNQPNRGADRRRDRRNQREEDRRLLNEQEELEAKILKVTEFVSANDLASLMDVSINEVISVCLNLGMFVSINQRLDAEAITVIADEFGFDVQFVSAEDETEAGVDVEADAPEDLSHRAPIVTIMGHVDHGKTSLLDYIRRAKVAAGEAGGITQHIGAYSVKTDDDRSITFLDTPGHEAFTAMRARGAKVTDVVIIVIAADDSVMPQTREAINHAQVAGVPIVFAFSKVDKPGADTEKIRNELASMNLLVEEWGGKYQAQEISSKSGMGVDDLLEKVLLEAELLELQANPDRRALGTVIEASLDKGRGYVSTVLVENGTLRQGDVMLVGAHYGRIRAMTNDRGERIKEAGPAQPVQILGLPGAPQAGDKFNVMETEREAREIANKREQLLREQTLRTRKHITLEEIGRRKAIGTFKELNVIVKGDVDGSVEALSDSLLQLSTEEVQVNIIHKAVGQISESDVLLASASDAVIVGFQVRPSASARKLAEQEQIEIRMYSIIYDAINEVKDAMEGLLAPTVEEVIVGNVEVRDVFKISKVGTVAGCYVTDGLIKRNNKIRIIRDFIVVHTGEISALKRFKDDVSEVRSGYECGLSIRNFNDIEVGDVIESFELKEVKRTL